MKKTYEEKEETKKGFIKEVLPTVVIGILIGLLIRGFLFNITYVSGMSMYPTLSHRDRVIVSKLSREYSKGDVVILDSPSDKKTSFIKRVIGTEGDIVEIFEGKVYLNGEELNERYIPANYVLVMGDNRLTGASLDSRMFGVVPVGSLKGVAKLRFFPLSKIGVL